MFNWLRRRRLSPRARKQLLLIAARAEEEIIETHVYNVLDLLETLGEEVDFDHGLEIYAEMMSLDEARASTVANRLLSRLDSPTKTDGRPRSTRAERARRFKNVFREESRR